MDRLELSVSRFRRSLWWMLWLRATVRSGVVGLWIAGSVILSLRLLWHLPVAQAVWVLSPLILLILVVGWLVRRKIPPVWAVRAMIDRSSRADGLVMADGEVELGAWKEKIHEQAIRNPEIHWAHSRSLGGVAAAAIFVLLTLAMPENWLTHERLFARELDMAADIERLSEKLEILEELAVLQKEDAEALQNELEKIEKDAEGTEPGKTLEAMAQLEDQLKKLAEDAAQKASEQAREASTLAAAAETLNNAASQMSEESLQKSMEQLAELTKKADANAQANGNDALEKASKLCQDGLSTDELKALAESLGGCSEAMQELLAQLAEAGMIDPDSLSEGLRQLSPEEIELLGEAFGECEGMECEDLDELLKACRLCLDGEPCDSFLGCFPVPGRGGIDRGPGHAKLNFSGETDEHGASFENKVIMPGGIKKDGKMVVKKLGLGAPGGDEAQELSTGGGLATESGTGGAHTRTVLPTHRRVVREYFERNGK